MTVINYKDSSVTARTSASIKTQPTRTPVLELFAPPLILIGRWPDHGERATAINMGYKTIIA